MNANKKIHRQLSVLCLCLGGLLCACNPSGKPKPVYPSAIEIVYGHAADSIFPDSIAVLIENMRITPQMYRWKNHMVLYDAFANTDSLRKEIMTKIPDVSVRLYREPFYVFDHALDCDSKDIAPEWEHVLMTANLVPDTTLQREYMNYHAHQPEQFPEVKQGFCNAEFQQLLVFRNGRQLMLVISIPKGKTLAELDPKTVENNPRVVEWNSIMGKYQEGIEGTKPGETWVLFEDEK